MPDYISPIAVVYSLDGVDNLQLSPKTLAEIFAGTITRWDDPAIAADNPDASLPSTRISPVHRADDSGTTDNFTAYLAAASGAWDDEPDGVWPLKSGEAAQGTSGVVAAVGKGNGAIGYADASQAGDLVRTSYLIACPTYDDSATADLVNGFLSYVLSDEGHSAAADNARSAPLPDDLQKKSTDLVAAITAP